eukprot:scaffold132287_cov33-Prasinocladus_malaysianus.AAC.1
MAPIGLQPAPSAKTSSSEARSSLSLEVSLPLPVLAAPSDLPPGVDALSSVEVPAAEAPPAEQPAVPSSTQIFEMPPGQDPATQSALSDDDPELVSRMNGVMKRLSRTANSAEAEILEYYMRVLLDPFHLLQRYSRRLSSKVDPVAKLFMVMVRDALFINDKHDEEKVRRYLLARGMTEAEVKRVGHTFFVRHCRRAIPPPQQLAARLQAVHDIFLDVKMSNGKLLYRNREGPQSSMAEEHRSIMTHVLSGCVSDHPNIPLYCSLGEPLSHVAASLPRHLYFRGSSQLEGFHRHLVAAVKTWNLAPEMMDAVILEFVTSWNMRAQEVNRSKGAVGHTDFMLMDAIVRKESQIWGPGYSLFPDYKETLEVAEGMLEQFGCGRPISSDSTNVTTAENVVDETYTDDAHEQQESGVAGADFAFPDEEEVDHLLGEAQAKPINARPTILSTARTPGGIWLAEQQKLPTIFAAFKTPDEASLMDVLLNQRQGRGNRPASAQVLAKAFNAQVQQSLDNKDGRKLAFKTAEDVKNYLKEVDKRKKSERTLAAIAPEIQRLRRALRDNSTEDNGVPTISRASASARTRRSRAKRPRSDDAAAETTDARTPAATSTTTQHVSTRENVPIPTSQTPQDQRN